MQKITIVEDDPAMREELVLLLENEGYQVQAVTEFTEWWRRCGPLARTWFCWIWACPARDGFSLCADLRKTCGVPIILVTSRNSTMDELRALSLGGDDYITKPYNIPILLARVKAVLRRGGGPAEPDVVEAGWPAAVPHQRDGIRRWEDGRA